MCQFSKEDNIITLTTQRIKINQLQNIQLAPAHDEY
jgi:hypothetical protein